MHVHAHTRTGMLTYVSAKLDPQNIVECLSAKILLATYTILLEVLTGIKFGSWVPNFRCKNTGRFKFGGSVRDRHMLICKYEILADF